MLPRAERADARANRDRLSESARKVLAARGLEFDMAEIAADGGVAIGTVYNHYGKRDDLLRTVIEQFLEEKRAAQRSLQQVVDPVEAIRFGIRVTFDLVSRWGMLMHQAYAGASMIPALDEFERGISGKGVVWDSIAPVIEKGRETGCFRVDVDTEFAVALYRGLFAGVPHLDGSYTYDQMADALTRLYLDAVAARPETGRSAN